MFYLFWALLNLGVFIFFISICFRAIKLLKENSGIFGAIIFVVGILSFIVNPNENKSNKKAGISQIPSWNFVSTDSVDRNTISDVVIELDKTWISKNELSITYGKNEKTEALIPISGNSWTTGFISGTKWNPSIIKVHATDDNTRLEYYVSGILEWKLLGAPLYSQYKNYNGTALIK